MSSNLEVLINTNDKSKAQKQDVTLIIPTRLAKVMIIEDLKNLVDIAFNFDKQTRVQMLFSGNSDIQSTMKLGQFLSF